MSLKEYNEYHRDLFGKEWKDIKELKENEIKLNGEIYDLRKVKEKDETLFLDGCQRLGTMEKLKGFWSKLCFFISLLVQPITQIVLTQEYRKAYFFFEERLEQKEKKKEEKKFKGWRKCNET